MECRLASTPQWMCWIAIRRQVDQAGKPLAEISEKPFGEQITDKNAVELALRRAQLAVLDPSSSTDAILKMDADTLREKVLDDKTRAFSRDVVCIDIEGTFFSYLLLFYLT
jgi:hypothetical protein